MRNGGQKWNSENAIPFIRTYSTTKSTDNIVQLFKSQDHGSRGAFSNNCENILSELHQGSKVFLTPSCSDALEMASQLIDLGPGDEVIMPSFNFTSGANAVSNFGAIPVFVDIDESGCIDLSKIQNKVSARTRAISWVNYGGQFPDVEKLKNLASKHKLVLIEDNAHSLGVKDEELILGTTGDFSTVSFHYTKNIQCGEGGALVINNKEYETRAHKIYEKGTNRHDFKNGLVSKYRWVDRGSSYVISEFSAAILEGQLQEYESIKKDRQTSAKLYKEYLSDFNEMNPFRFSTTSERRFLEAAHLFPLMFPSQFMRDFVADALKKENITAVSHYETLHSSPKAIEILKGNHATSSEEMTSYMNQFPVANQFSAGILRLPLWSGMSSEEIQRVVENLVKSVRLFLKSYSR